jgi:hypothetical protein
MRRTAASAHRGRHDADGKKRSGSKKQAAITDDKVCTEPQVLIPANLSSIVGACGEQARYALASVRVTILDANQYRLDATDGCCAVIVTGEGDPPADFPFVGELAGIDPSVKQVLIPSAIWKKAFASVPKRGMKPILQNVAMAFGKDDGKLVTTDFETGANVISFRQQEGKFPPIDAVIPNKARKPKIKVRFAPAVMIKALSVADALTRDRVGEVAAVELSIYDQDSAMLLEAVGHSKSQRIQAVVMPVTASDVDTKAHTKKMDEKVTKKEKIRLLMTERSTQMWNLLRELTGTGYKQASSKKLDEARRFVAEVKKDILMIDAWIPTGYTKTQEELDAEAEEQRAEAEAAKAEAKDCAVCGQAMNADGICETCKPEGGQDA